MACWAAARRGSCPPPGLLSGEAPPSQPWTGTPPRPAEPVAGPIGEPTVGEPISEPGEVTGGIGLAKGAGGALNCVGEAAMTGETGFGDGGGECAVAASGAEGSFRPHGFVGAKDILGFGGSEGLAGAAAGAGAGTAAGAAAGFGGVRPSGNSCTNQQSLPKLQWPLMKRSHGLVPIRSGLLFFPK